MPILRTRLKYNGNVKSEEVSTIVNTAKRASIMSILYDDQQNTILPLLTNFRLSSFRIADNDDEEEED
ncbi:hypothetical protein ALC62_09479 [Cyphomyrmex costatus]|uniref:Uncharacterized protein n=1 Tax=Cyphomyrmex costatus TaxID=456900 RepID=A0A195CGK3_9HYME|nr:hypothetical protein ALC62_09479 [Cyphomyrmex costatus]